MNDISGPNECFALAMTRALGESLSSKHNQVRLLKADLVTRMLNSRKENRNDRVHVLSFKRPRPQ